MYYYIVHHDSDTETVQLLRFRKGGVGLEGMVGQVVYTEKSDLSNQQIQSLWSGRKVYNEKGECYNNYLDWTHEWKLRLSAHSGIKISDIQ
jgi:hypothetical protein